jgi:hypothetical protein
MVNSLAGNGNRHIGPAGAGNARIQATMLRASAGAT